MAKVEQTTSEEILYKAHRDWVNLAIIAVPNTATVTLTHGSDMATGTGMASLRVPKNEDISYEITHPNYTTITGTVSMSDTQIVTINMNDYQYDTLTIVPTPSDAEVTLIATGYMQEGNSITVKRGVSISYAVEKEHYVTVTGSYATQAPSNTLNINLEAEKFSLTVNPTPSDSTVTLSAPGFTQVGNSIEVDYNTSVAYEVTKSYYTPVLGNLVIQADETLNITLQELPKYTLTIDAVDEEGNPITNFTVEFSAPEGTITENSIEVHEGTTVGYTVIAEGYLDATGSIVVTGTTSIDVTMEPATPPNWVGWTNKRLYAWQTVNHDIVYSQNETVVTGDRVYDSSGEATEFLFNKDLAGNVTLSPSDDVCVRNSGADIADVIYTQNDNPEVGCDYSFTAPNEIGSVVSDIALSTTLDVVSSNPNLTIQNDYSGTKSQVGVETERLTCTRSQAAQLPTTAKWESVCYGNGKFVAVADSSSKAAYSIDGINWTETELPSSAKWKSVCYGGGKYVAVNYAGSSAYSTDGINWTETTISSTDGWFYACYGDNKFVAVNYGSNKAAYSTDGINWTASTLPSSQSWTYVNYGNGKFIAMSYNTSIAAYSTDGINWVSMTLPSAGTTSSWRSVCYANGKFVAVAGGYSTSTVAYSANGTEWTSLILDTRYLCSVCYGNDRFVILPGNGGTSNKAAYSMDGINWTIITLPSGADYQASCYGDNRFVSLIYNTNKAAYSTDGINWTNQVQSWQNSQQQEVQLSDYQLSITSGTPAVNDTLDLTYTTTTNGIIVDGTTYNRNATKDKSDLITDFYFEVKTDAYTSDNTQFSLPINNATYINPITVDWGDGNQEVLSSGTYPSHTYATAGTYEVRVHADSGKMPYLYWYGVNSSTYKYSNMQLTKIKSALMECYQGTNVVTAFTYCFSHCEAVTTIPQDLFRYNTAVTNFDGCFSHCEAVTTIPQDLFRYNTVVTNFTYCFADCYSLTTIPQDLFRYNTAVTNFDGCFSHCEAVTTIPQDLFKYNTVVTNFNHCFHNCSSLIEIPQDLFKYNVSVTNFSYCFHSCSLLTEPPQYLFRYNILVNNFSFCFRDCPKLQLNSNIFCDEATEITTRFANIRPDFQRCFEISSFSGVKGTAPQLWNYTYKSIPTSDSCFDGHSTTSLTNYNDIPSAWKY